jgi:hypothetical protein
VSRASHEGLFFSTCEEPIQIASGNVGVGWGEHVRVLSLKSWVFEFAVKPLFFEHTEIFKPSVKRNRS